MTPAAAQDAERRTEFEAVFFRDTQPANAYEMLLLLPGFALVEGDSEVRGYSGAAGNVLIDGERPAGKTVSLEAMLKRIPAARVAKIELIRAGSSHYDMQGYALLANIILTKTGGVSGRIEAEQALYRHGRSAPRLAAQASIGNEMRGLDLFGTVYREIDDEHGFGVRHRYAADGTAMRLAGYAQPEGADVVQSTVAYRQPVWGGSLQLNGLVQDKRKFADIDYAIYYPAVEAVVGSERKHVRTHEGGLRYEHALGPETGLEIVGSYRSEASIGVDREMTPSESSLSEERETAREIIFRAALRGQRGRSTIDLGAEGAINSLDGRNGLIEDGIEVPLPNAAIKVAERRAEFFATLSRPLAARTSAEFGIRYEVSRLTQTGDTDRVKSLAFLKPRIRLSWTPTATETLRLLVEREVGQLDFGDFVGAASLTSGTISAGNADLEPDSLWRLELSWERRFGSGSLTAVVRREWISDLVDQLPLAANGVVYDAVGNIGAACRLEFEASLKFPLERLGARGVVVTADMLARRSRARDPLTGEARRISDDAPFEGRVSFAHDITEWKLRWGGSYSFARSETRFKVDEIETERLGGRLDLFAEYRPDQRWTFRLFGRNLTDSAATRARDIYDGVRGRNPLRFRELRLLRSGRYVGLTIERSFGATG